ncbi:MAG TPA: sigma-54-dependent Fis family transcriptional regulator [Rhodobacteraceae bacterium]|nr:sigma-54-dependent Fis family transcriptional regulator [Paracoccaceae bacterium]
MSLSILLVDDDREVREALGQSLEIAGYPVVLAGSFIEALDYISPEFEGVVLSDVRMPGKDGFALLERCKQVDSDLPVVLITGEGDVPMAVRAMKAGALNFLEKPVSNERLCEVVARACGLRATVLENRALKARLAAKDAAERLIIGQSEATQNLRRQLRVVAAARSDALIIGETGVGKELAARVIHALSGSNAPFIAVNCGMLTEGLTQAVLFGDTTRKGAFARADGGTIFLDEIGAMPLDQQVNLLRILEERIVEDRLGRPQKLDIRVLAASHENLPDMVASGRFRPDLFFRLDVARLQIPPLRERPEDIGVLYMHFLEEAQAELGLPHGPVALAGLLAKNWPGNARELRNHARRAAMGLDDAENVGAAGLSAALEQVEAHLIEQSLIQFNGKIPEVCAALKLPRKTLYDKLKRHGIKPERFR